MTESLVASTGTVRQLTAGLLAASLHGLVEDGEVFGRVQLFDFVPVHGDIAQRVGVEGEGAARFLDQLAVQGIAVFQHQRVRGGCVRFLS